MDINVLTQRANDLKALINSTEKFKCFHIDAFVPQDNIILVVPAYDFYDTLWNYNKVLAWADLHNFSAIMCVSPKNQPCLRLVHPDYASNE